MNNLQTLKLSDNFDVWRDLINKSIVTVNSLVTVPLSSSNQIGFVLSNSYNPDTSETTIFWKDMNVILKELGINTGGSGGTDTEVEGTHFPTGLTVGLDDTNTSYVKLLPTGNIDASNNIDCLRLTARGDITTQENIIAAKAITGNKVTSSTSLNGQNVELTSSTPYIDFNYGNTSSDFTSRIIENKNGVLTINGNDFTTKGTRIHTDLRLFTELNDVIFRHDDKDFYILTSKLNEEPTSLRPLTINLGTGEVTFKHTISAQAINCSNVKTTGNVEVGGNLIVAGTETIKGNATYTKNVTINGTLTVENLVPKKLTINATDLNLAPNIHSGAGSSFVSDLYVNSASNSLIIRNDASNVYLLVGDTVGSTWNNLRPFSFNMSNGLVSMNNGANISALTVTSNTSVGGSLTVAKNITATGNITGNRVYNAIFNDYAEFFEKGEETEVGDIVALDTDSKEERYIKATNPRTVVGVHSDSYGHILGGFESIENSEESFIPVGMSGRVKTKIIGAIEKGDEVVLSKYPGIGRKYHELTDRERDIIGFAVETNLSEEVKLVRIKI